MKILLIVVSAAIIIFILKACVSGDQLANDKSRPDIGKKPINKKDNDKIIVVSNINHEDIKNALIKFCNIYNKDRYDAMPRLVQIGTNNYAVTFPYDIDFVTFCFAVNFLKYPTDIKASPQVIAWATSKQSDEWITEKSADKKVMLFLADDDKEYDNVFLTTPDNIGYKLGFAAGQEKQLLSTPKKSYINPTVDLQSLKELKFEDLE